MTSLRELAFDWGLPRIVRSQGLVRPVDGPSFFFDAVNVSLDPCPMRGKMLLFAVKVQRKIVTGEIWKSIPGIEYYEASSLGRIRSLDRYVEVNPRDRKSYRLFMRGKILKQVERKQDGRLVVSIHQCGDFASMSVSILVCMAFHGERRGRYALHKNDVCSDNRAENLYWGDAKANAEDAITNGGRFAASIKISGERHGGSKLTEQDVFEIRKMSADGVAGLRIAKMKGVSRANVSMIINRKIWDHI